MVYIKGMKKSLIVLFVLLLAVCFVSCANTRSRGSGAQELTEIDNRELGLRAWVEKGGYLYVEIPGNPTTGYEWTFTIEDDDIVEDFSSEYLAANQAGLVGAGGVYRFGFKAEREGKTDIRFIYARHWEFSPAAVATYRVIVDSSLNITLVPAD